MNTKEYLYTWHLSLRVDRPVEGCTIRPHAYMYGKKLDERDQDKPLQPHSKKMREPPPANLEFSYRWFRGPPVEPCAFEQCPRRNSFSPHDWSMHALGGSGSCSLQCVSTQSSLYLCTFCNSNCFVQAWKTQYTVPKEARSFTITHHHHHASNGGGSGTATPVHQRSRSFGSNGIDDDTQSVESAGSFGPNMNGTKSPNLFSDNLSAFSSSSNPGTPRGFVSGYKNSVPNSAGGYNSSSSSGGGVVDSANTTTMDPFCHHHHSNSSNDEWMEISRDQVYVPGPDDVGRKVKLEAAAYAVETGELLMHRVVTTDIVLSRPPEPIKRNLITSKASSGGGARFRIATYNVLAEIYATQQQYPYCDFWALSWDYRFQNIMREILDASPEVVCLQEVQADHYENHLYPAMSEAGFEGVYKQKTRQSMGLVGKVDGCALFWRRAKFHLVESYSIEFNELAQRQASQVLGLNPRSEEGVAFLNRLSKDNVAQLVVLELAQPTMASRTNREPINQVCIANTHLYSNKDFPDVKLWQCWQLLQELETFVMSRGTNLPLMICGDFNSTPDTAVYDLLSRQAVHPGHPDVNMNNNSNNNNNDEASSTNVLPDAMNITHSFQLGSAYQTVMGDEPRQTNFTSNFKGVLDYIWYSVQNLRPLSAAPIPEDMVLTRHGEALPSTEYSSDHIMLISDMQIISGNGGGGARPP